MSVLKKEKDNNNSIYVGNNLPDYYGDERLLPYISHNKNGFSNCIYCGEIADSREHIPSKIFLDELHSNELSIVPSCSKCNNSYSSDEQYVACLIEWLYAKSYNLSDVRREKIRKTFLKRPIYLARFEEASKIEKDGTINIGIASDRIKRIIVKLARGHVAYNLSEIMLDEPTQVSFAFYPQLSEETLYKFNSNQQIYMLPEIGSRAFRRVVMDDSDYLYEIWRIVEDERYRFLTFIEGSITVRIVIGEFLYCEVIW